MTRPAPIIEIKRSRGLSRVKELALKAEARRIAVLTLAVLERQMEGRGDEFRTDTKRELTRLLAAGWLAHSDTDRVTGILAGAQAFINPVHEPKGRDVRAQAEALFEGAS